MQNRRTTALFILLLVLLNLFVINVVTLAHASSANVNAVVDDKIAVEMILTFENTTLYEEVKANPSFNATTIPQAMKTSLQNRGFLDVVTSYDLGQQLFDDTQESATINFNLGGGSIQSASINRDTMRKIVMLRMQWRKFAFNLTSTLSVNMEEFFGKPLLEWTNTTDAEGRFALSLSSSQSDGAFSQATFSLALPKQAKNVQFSEEGERIFYDMPLSLGDNLVNSPLLILAAFSIIVFLAYTYREIVRIVRQKI